MADELDLASEREEIARQDALRTKRPTGPAPSGRCHFCDEIVDDGARWCNVDCRNSWEREQARGRR